MARFRYLAEVALRERFAQNGQKLARAASTVGVLFDPLNSAQTDQLDNELAAAATVLAARTK